VDPVLALWRRWVAERDPADRERLILHHAPLVKYVAGRLSVGVSAAVELGDLISYGVFGLIDAIERYDPERGPRFASYAIGRIKGAIMDELRAVDWVPRAVREHARAVQTALAELEAQLRRTPTDGELAAHMGITVARLRELLDQISLTSLVALDALFVDDDGGHHALAETLHDPHAVDPQRRMERRELRAELASAIQKLSARDRTVIVLYYVEGMTLAQIAQILQVTESRVSQLHTRAVLALRAKLHASMRSA
jgi:RNA polymerase sigma factor for flagellar operon FliA